MNNTEHHKGERLHFAGRAPTSSVATGSKKAHQAEVKKVRSGKTITKAGARLTREPCRFAVPQ